MGTRLGCSVYPCCKKPDINAEKRDRRYKNLHFLVPTVVFQDSRSLREGDAFTGNVGIAPVSGLLKINAGGVFGLMEGSWNAQNSYSAAYPSTASRRPHGRYCLNEGIGRFDKNKTSNLQITYNDVAHSKDSKLLEQVTSNSCSTPTGVKRCFINTFYLTNG